MKTLQKIKSEKSNIWAFISLLTDFAAAGFVALSAYKLNEVGLKVLLAFIGSVLIVNILAKLYSLVRK